MLFCDMGTFGIDTNIPSTARISDGWVGYGDSVCLHHLGAFPLLTERLTGRLTDYENYICLWLYSTRCKLSRSFERRSPRGARCKVGLI